MADEDFQQESLNEEVSSAVNRFRRRATSSVVNIDGFDGGQHAKALRIGRETSLPAKAIIQDVDEIERSQYEKNAASVLERYPALYRTITGNDSYAGILRDDIVKLGKISENKLLLPKAGLDEEIKDGRSSARKSGGAFLSGITASAEGFFGFVRSQVNNIEEYGPFAYVPGTAIPIDRLAQVSIPALDAGRKAVGNVTKDLMPDTSEFGIVERSWYSALQSVGLQVGNVAVTLMTGNPTYGLTSMYVTSYGNAYGDAKDQGAPEEVAQRYATFDAIIEVGTESIPFNRLFKDITVGTPFFKTLMRQALTEVPGEQIATALQDLNEWINLNPDKTLQEYVQERPERAAETALTTLFSVGLQTGAVKIVAQAPTLIEKATEKGKEVFNRDQERANAAEQNAEQITELADEINQLEAIKHGDEGREAIAESLNQSNPNDFIYVPKDSIADVDQIELEVTNVDRGGVDSVVIDATDEVPMKIGDFMAKYAGTEKFNELIGNIRFGQDAMTLNEANAFRQQGDTALADEVAKATARVDKQEKTLSSFNKVKEFLVKELQVAGRFTGDVNDLYATLTAHYYGTRAGDLEISPEELFSKDKLRTAAQTPLGEDSLSQLEPIVLQNEEFKEWFADSQIADSEGRATPVYKDQGSNETDATRFVQQENGTPAHYVRINNPFIANEPNGVAYSQDRINELKVQGYDGIVNEATDEVIAFESDQIKSSEDFSFAQKIRGSFTPSKNLISLLDDADLSTFLHELGHFFFENDIRLATQILRDKPLKNYSPGEQRILDDVDELLKYLEIGGDTARDRLRQWRSLEFEQKRDYHEKIANSFELYLLEGKAPTNKLQPLFRRFSDWLKNVYVSVKNFLRLYPQAGKLSDEVRMVFDRMLASDAEIQKYKEQYNMTPLFGDETTALMSEELRAEYQDKIDQSTYEATEDRTAKRVRDIRYLHKVRSKTLRKLQRDYEDVREAARPEAEEIVMKDPIYQAWQLLTKGLAGDSYKLSTQGLLDAGFTVEQTKRLRNFNMVRREGGLTPDEFISLLPETFSSGDELIQNLLTVPTIKDAVESVLDKLMLERYSELTPDNVEETANRIVANENWTRVVATELNVVGKLIGKPRVANEAAKAYAEERVSDTEILKLTPGQFRKAASRFARNAEKAFRAGDLEGTYTNKRKQIVNEHLDRSVSNARDEFAKGLKYLKKFGKPGNLPADQYMAILRILEKFDLHRLTEKERSESKSVEQYIASQLKKGEVPPEFERLLPKAARALLKNELKKMDDEKNLVYDTPEKQIELIGKFIDQLAIRNIHSVSMREFRGIVDAVRQLEHVGRRTKKILTDKRKREFVDVVEQLRTNIMSVAAENKRNPKKQRTRNTRLERLKVMGKEYFFDHLKARALFEVVDGKQDGMLRELLMESANEATSQELLALSKLSEKLTGLLDEVKKQGPLQGRKKFFSSINDSLTHGERLSLALNLGNAGNQQRLLGGSNWTMANVQPILDTLTEADWTFVQGVWDLYETTKPLWLSTFRELNGYEPEMVEPQPMTVTTADGKTLNIRGGYAPIVYDPRSTGIAESHDKMKTADLQMQQARNASTVSKSFTKPRVEEVTGRPLSLDLSRLITGIQDGVHYAYWQPWQLDANRIINAIDPQIRAVYGPEMIKTMKLWVSETAAGSTQVNDGINQFSSFISRNVSFGVLAINIINGLQQITGLAPSIAVLGRGGGQFSGYGWLMSGIKKVAQNPPGAYQEMIDKSAFMQERASNYIRDMAEVNQILQDQSKLARVNEKVGYAFTSIMQSTVDMPTWWAAYNRAVHEQGGLEIGDDGTVDDSKAIALADQAVIDSQGSGLRKDLASVERKTGITRLLTPFYSYMNAMLNQNYTVLRSDANIVKKLHDLALINAVPVALSLIIKDALKIGDDDKGEDDPFWKRYIRSQFSYLLGQLVYIRDIGGVLEGYDYRGPGGGRLFQSLERLIKQSQQMEVDVPLIKAALAVTSAFIRFPVGLVENIVEGTAALSEGETSNPAVLVLGYSP